jgi:hypothetical protein
VTHKYKTVRIDWEIYQVDVDEFESEQRGTIKVLGTYGSLEEVQKALPQVAKKKFPKWDNSGWVPLNADHDYQKVYFQRKEVILKEWEE